MIYLKYFVILLYEVVALNYGITSAVSTQVLVMAIFMAVGFVLTKTKVLTRSGTKQMTDLLLYIVTPCVIVMAFQDGYNTDSITGLAVAFGVSIALHIFYIFATWLLYRCSTNPDRVVVDRFCIIFSNCGFMGIPLLEAALGPNGVFIGSAYLATFNVVVWTAGYSMFNKGNNNFSYAKALLNPGVIGITVALILMLSDITLKGAALSAVDGMAALNTPVAMVLLGVYLGESKIFTCLKSLSVYAVLVLRLIALPIVSIFILKVLNVDSQIALAITLSASCPCAAISAIFASQFGKDSGYASSVVALSTLVSLATLPFVAYVASMIFS